MAGVSVGKVARRWCRNDSVPLPSYDLAVSPGPHHEPRRRPGDHGEESQIRRSWVRVTASAGTLRKGRLMETAILLAVAACLYTAVC